MKLSIVIILALLIVVTGSTAATLIYYAIYRSILRKRVASGISKNTGKSNMMEPVKFFIICFIIMMFISFGFLMLCSVKSDVSVSKPSFLFEKMSEDDLTYSLSSEEKITGYERHEVEDGDLKVVYYVKTGPGKAFPKVLIHVAGISNYDYTYALVEGESNDGGFGTGEPNCWYAFTEDNVSGTLDLNFNSGDSEIKIEIPI